jgi:hypothetical protein
MKLMLSAMFFLLSRSGRWSAFSDAIDEGIREMGREMGYKPKIKP